MKRLFHSRLIAPAILGIALAAGLAPAADEVSMRIDVNRRQIYQGESIILQVNVSGLSAPPEPDLSGIPQATVQFLGSQSQDQVSITMINGRVTRSGFFGRLFTYQVTPSSTGEFKTGPVVLKLKDKTLTAIGPSVTVSGIEKQDVVQIRIEASREAVLVDEPFDIRLVVAMKALSNKYRDLDPLDPGDPPKLEAPFIANSVFNGLEQTDIREILQPLLIQRPNQAGFAINDYKVQSPSSRRGFFFDDIYDPQTARFALERASATLNGQPAWEYAIRLSYRPREEGSYTFGPVIFKGRFIEKIEDVNRVTTRPIFAVGPAVTVRVVPPPEEGRPFSFIGAIGSNLVARAGLDTQLCKIGDPLTLTLSVSGNVTLRNISPPPLNAQPDIVRHFRVYDDTVRTSRNPDGVDFAYTIRPTASGTIELPPIELSYYDALSRAYRTVTTQPIPLQVREAVQMVEPVSLLTNGLHELPSLQPGDWLPAPLAMGRAGPGSDGLALHPRHLATLLGGPLAWAALLVAQWLFRTRIQTLKSWRRRTALSHALRDLRHLARRTTGPAVAAEHYALVRDYLSRKCDIPAGGLTPDDAHRRLLQLGIPAEPAARIHALLEALFNSAYATPATPTGQTMPTEPAAAAPEFKAIEAALRELERRLRGAS